MENLGALSGINIYPQPTPGSDAGITSGFALDLAGKTSYRGGRKQIEVPNFKRVRRTPGQLTGKADASGLLPCNLSADMRNKARILALHVGPDGYSRVGGLHIFRNAGRPAMFEVEKIHVDTGSDVTNRECENFSDDITHKFSEDGAAQFDWTVSGSGRRVLNTPLAGPPTLADEVFVASSYFDAFMHRGGSLETECSDFTFSLKNAIKRQAKILTGRGIGTKYAGLPRGAGKLGVIFEDYSFLQDAIDGADIPIECVWGSGDPTVAAQFYERHRMNIRLEEMDEDVGGEDMTLIDQAFNVVYPRSGGKLAAEIICPTIPFDPVTGLPTTFTIPASSVLKFKHNGGAGVSCPITAGDRSYADIVADVLAVAGYTAFGGADLFTGRARFSTTVKGASESLQIDTTAVGSIHALLGLDNVARVGYDGIDWVAEIMTDLAVDLI